MTCKDCRLPLSVEQTLKGDDCDVRIQPCGCGSRWLTEARIIRRLQGTHIQGTGKANTGQMQGTNPSPGGGGVGGGVPEGPIGPDSDSVSQSSLLGNQTRARRNRRAETPAFAAFYDLFPRKKKRPDALKAWHQMSCERISLDIMNGLRDQLAEFADRPPDKVPYPASYLRGAEWRDAPTPIRAVKPAETFAQRQERERREATEAREEREIFGRAQ